MVIVYDLGCPTFFIYVFPVHIVKYTKMQIKIIGHPKSYASIIENNSRHADPCAEKVIAYDLGCPFLFTVHIVKNMKMKKELDTQNHMIHSSFKKSLKVLRDL